MNTISTHVLDTALGEPAAGIAVTLEHDGAVIFSGVTDADGRLRGARPRETGDYAFKFAVGEYFGKSKREAFYHEIVIKFRIANDADHYHVPLLLSPFGYTTYRGS